MRSRGSSLARQEFVAPGLYTCTMPPALGSLSVCPKALETISLDFSGKISDRSQQARCHVRRPPISCGWRRSGWSERKSRSLSGWIHLKEPCLPPSLQIPNPVSPPDLKGGGD